MGLKKLVEKYGIGHITQISGGVVCIGSGYVGDLITIDLLTGAVSPRREWEYFLREDYPQLQHAKPEEILSVLNEEDKFDRDIPVFTYDEDRIIELRCEEFGYPNTTHCGKLMYENTFFKTKEEAIKEAKRVAELNVDSVLEDIKNHESEFERIKDVAAKATMTLFSLKKQFPEIK